MHVCIWMFMNIYFYACVCVYVHLSECVYVRKYLWLTDKKCIPSIFFIFIFFCTIDLVFILLDKPDESFDRMISEHIMRTHAINSDSNSNSKSNSTRHTNSQNTSKNDEDLGPSSLSLSQRLRRAVVQYEDQSTSSSHSAGHEHSDALLTTEAMRKYIEYARRYCSPKLTKSAAKVYDQYGRCMH